MSVQDIKSEIEKFQERNDEKKPMKNWNQNILFKITDLEIGFHAFFADDGTITKIDEYEELSDDLEAHVILEGKSDSWISLLRGKLRPARALLLRKIKVQKGTAREILPLTSILGGKKT